MDYLFAILQPTSNLSSLEKRVIKFLNVGILIVKETELSIDVVKHTFKECEAALKYGSICISLTQLFEFLSSIDRSNLRTGFTIFIQTTESDPTKWNLESIFLAVHYNYQKTSVIRDQILDMDQVCFSYPFFSTKVGTSVKQFYLDIHNRYHNNVSSIAQWDEYEDKPMIPSGPPASLFYDGNTFEMNAIAINDGKMNERAKYDDSSVLLLPPSYSTRHENGSLEPEPSELCSGRLFPVYKPVLYEEQRCGEQEGILKNLMRCLTRTEPKFMSRVELERYDNVLYHGMRDRVCQGKRLTAIEILTRGAAVKRGVEKKSFYSIKDIKEHVSPIELCEYVSREWNVDIELLLPLIHYAIRSSDMVMARIILDILKKLLKKRFQSERVTSTNLIVGKKCKKCVYDHLSQKGRPHYHIELLDKLFHQDLVAFKRYTTLAFELLNVPVNIQKDGEYLELELF